MAKFKISLGMFGVQDLFAGDAKGFIEVAKAADQIGIDQIVFTDHVIMSENTVEYPFGPFPVPPQYPWFEPMTLMSAVAGATQSIRVATGVLIAPLRPAALLAKMCATLDLLSDGRLDLGVGVGWQAEEYVACGFDFNKRWKMLDDQLQVMKKLWQEAPVSITTETVSFDRLYSTPHPQQKNAIPVWFGVAPTERQARRIAQFGQGWIPISSNPETIKKGVDLISEAFIKAGRDPETLLVRAHAHIKYQSDGKADLDYSISTLAGIVEAGATHIEFETAPFVRGRDDLLPFLEKINALR